MRSIVIAGVRYRPLMATLSTHVLDTASGRPASGVSVSLEQDGAVVARGVTDADGRIAGLAASLAPGRYRLVFGVVWGFLPAGGAGGKTGAAPQQPRRALGRPGAD